MSVVAFKIYLCTRGPIFPVVLRWKVLLPGIGPSIYQPSPNVTMQILDRVIKIYDFKVLT